MAPVTRMVGLLPALLLALPALAQDAESADTAGGSESTTDADKGSDAVDELDRDDLEYQKEKAAQDELRQLKAELKRVTEERDILKEAAAYFAGESKKNTRS